MSNLGKYTERIAATLLKEEHFYKIVNRSSGENGLIRILEVVKADGNGRRFVSHYTFEVMESRKYAKQIYKGISVAHGFFERNEFFLNPEHHKTEAKKPKHIIHNERLLDELEIMELRGNIDRAIDRGDRDEFMRLSSQLKEQFVNN